MPDPSVLERLVVQIGWQIRRRRAEFYGLRGLFYGALLGLVPLLVKRALGPWAPGIALGVTLAGALGGALRGVGLGLGASDAARLADRAFNLRDRVATALEWAARPDRTPLVGLLVADVTARLGGLDGRRAVRRLWPRELKFLPIPALLLVALALTPPIPLPAGGLPPLSVSDDSESPQERAGRVVTDERPAPTKRELFQRAEVMGRTLSARQGSTGSSSQPGDLAALFKDTALAAQRPDFNSFLKKGDERLRMLEQVDRLPDLQRDFTQSPFKLVFQKRKELFGGLRADQVSPQKLRELMEEMERVGRKGGNWSGDIGEGMEALESGQTNRAMEAMERALSKMRAMEERGRGERGLRGGRDEARRGGRGAERGGGGNEMDEFGEGEGLLPGKGTNPSHRGNPTERLRAMPFDAGVEGQARSGRKEGYDTNLVGKGASMPSRLQYLGVLGQYRKMMEEALAREQVPRDYQTQVREYFESLEDRR